MLLLNMKMYKLENEKAFEDFIKSQSEDFTSNADFLSYGIWDKNEHFIKIVKSKLTKSNCIVSYREFIEILDVYKEYIDHKLLIEKINDLCKIAQKYNVAIITATQPKDPFSRSPNTHIKYGQDVIFIDYADLIKPR